jgi:hypothetical protein
MALVEKNADGTYASTCEICGQPLTEPLYATSHFIEDQSHDLYRFSDAAMHWDCYANWPQQARFASMYFDSCVKMFETDRWLHYWRVLWRSEGVLVQYGVSSDKILISLRRTGTDISIPREKWLRWLGGEWRGSCRQPLECQEVERWISEFEKLSLPERGDESQSV